ncbi:MAG: DNA polymerase/3'-5' exonuclease PolX [Bacteroidetes bacterium]|nr:DNA polymerase/3'-5' exonuclease PolX [Bacteroidota bacterium]
MLSNKEVSTIFKTIGGLMELHGENDFKTKSYANAAFQIGRIHELVLSLEEADLASRQGIGKSVAAKIVELRDTGTISALEELMAVTPPGIIEILRIKGLGGKKVGVIWKELGIETVGELLYACNENRLSKLKGFGEKTQQSVIDSINYYQSNQGKFRYAAVADYASLLVTELQTAIPDALINLSRGIRRQNNIIDTVNILINRDAKINEHIQSISFLSNAIIEGDFIKGKTETDVQYEIKIVDDKEYYYQLFVETGSPEFVATIQNKLGGKTTFSSEAEIFAAAGMPYVLPELRESTGLMEVEGLIELSDIQGVVHNHSTWSDGKNTIAEMAAGCLESGYTYFVISDHSKTAVYAGGLTEQQIIAQHKEIDALNKTSGIKIFKSIECDILNDGSMDYDDLVLSTFDFVIASIHQNLKMDEEKATQRLLRAIENPYTTILGHMTGRLLLSRPGYPVDHKK